MIDFIRRHKLAFAGLLVIIFLSTEGYIRKIRKEHFSKRDKIEQSKR